MDNNFEDGQEWPPKYTASEQECINYIEAMPDNEKEFETEKCHYDRKLWNYFQNCALAIAQLYRGVYLHVYLSRIIIHILLLFSLYK